LVAKPNWKNSTTLILIIVTEVQYLGKQFVIELIFYLLVLNYIWFYIKGTISLSLFATPSKCDDRTEKAGGSTGKLDLHNPRCKLHRQLFLYTFCLFILPS
jgi:hypothetical protein